VRGASVPPLRRKTLSPRFFRRGFAAIITERARDWHALAPAGGGIVKVNLIPSTVAGSDPCQFLSSAIINDTIGIDAGCIGFYLTPQQQAKIRHVFVSHTHMDHIASLPIYVENAYEAKPDCVTIHGSSDVLDCVQKDIFNDRIWPDFIALSKGSVPPFVKMALFEAGQTVEIDGVRISAVAINHVVPTVAYILSDANGSIGFVSDTAQTDEVWQRLNALPDLKAVFLEATFPDNMAWLADISKHLTPKTFALEIAKLNRPVRVIAVHIKARFRAQVVAELQALGMPNLEIGRFDAPYVF
jgi:ribonuclease BN (tRNA processing enzyme)